MTTTGTPDVSVVIVSWNTRDLVLQCLASLPVAAGKVVHDALVVDNASTDGTAEAVRAQYPTVVMVRNTRNEGFAAANNRGIRQSGGRYVLLLNSDTLPTPGSIAALVAFADAHPEAGAVGAMLLHGDGRFQASFQDAPGILSECLSALGVGRRLIFDGYPGYGPAHSRSSRPVDVISGACMLLRRAALDQVGLLDEAYFMYSEETDLCWRLRQAGWQVWYQPEARIVHLGGQSTRQAPAEMIRALYRSKVRYLETHRGTIQGMLLRILLVAILRVKWLVSTLSRNGSRFPLIRWRDLSGAADHARPLP